MIEAKIEEPIEVPKYPYLGKHKFSEQVVLFTSPKIGTVLITGIEYIGTHRTDWIESNFEPLNGKVELSNL